MKIDWASLFIKFLVFLCVFGTCIAFAAYLYSLYNWPKITGGLTLVLFAYVYIEDWIKEYFYKKRKK